MAPNFDDLVWVAKNPHFWINWPYLILHKERPGSAPPFEAGSLVVGHGPVVFEVLVEDGKNGEPIHFDIASYNSWEEMAKEWHLW